MQNEDLAETLAVRRRNEEVRRRRAARLGYGTTSSYTPASDTCSAPFVPAADNYTPPPADPTPSCDSGGGSFDGGASGDYGP